MRPSWVSCTRAPSPSSSALSAASRSVSWPRMWATPWMWLVSRASAARAATTGVSSLAAPRSRSVPSSWSVPVTVSPCSVSLTSAPKTERMSRSWSPGCRVPVGQCGTVTEPPVAAAAAKKGAALERSGSTTTSRGAIGPGATAQRSGPAVVDLDAALAQHGDRHRDVGQRRHRRALVADLEPTREPGADEQQGADELRRGRRVDGDRAAGGVRTAGRP